MGRCVKWLPVGGVWKERMISGWDDADGTGQGDARAGPGHGAGIEDWPGASQPSVSPVATPAGFDLYGMCRGWGGEGETA